MGHALPGLDELEAAAAIVYRHMQGSPQLNWPLLSARCGCNVWVKHENHNPTGAFKVRGGLVYLERLREREPAIEGVVTATRGNHGQSIAFAAARHDLRSVVVVPEGNNADKNRAMQSLGAETSSLAAVLNKTGSSRMRPADAQSILKVPVLAELPDHDSAEGELSLKAALFGRRSKLVKAYRELAGRIAGPPPTPQRKALRDSQAGLSSTVTRAAQRVAGAVNLL